MLYVGLDAVGTTSEVLWNEVLELKARDRCIAPVAVEKLDMVLSCSSPLFDGFPYGEPPEDLRHVHVTAQDLLGFDTNNRAVLDTADLLAHA